MPATDAPPVHKAIREALANCFANADFNIRRGIVIKKEGDVIIMENPGCIRTGKEQMLKGGISDPRNATIMKILNLVGIGERAGSGVPGILSVWESEGWKKPEVQEQYNPDRTILTLTLATDTAKKVSNKSVDKKVSNKTAEKGESSKTHRNYSLILSNMEAGTEYRVDDFCDLLGLKSTRVRVLFRELAAAGKLEARGTTRNRRYVKIASVNNGNS